jgi:hypothetical protein
MTEPITTGALTARLVQLLDRIQGNPGGADLAALAAAIVQLAGDPAASLRGVVTELGELAAVVEALRGVPDTDLATLADGLYTQTLPRSPYLLGISSRLADMEARLDTLQAALGAEPYQSLELGSARGYLAAILAALQTQNEGIPPISTVGDTPSNGDVVISGRKYAIFLPPITGATVAANGYDLTPTGSWLGWNAYIQTTDPTPRINSATDIPNQWLALAGSGSINFNVAQQYPIRVFLRAPQSAGAFTWFWDLGEISQVSTGAGTRWLPVTNKYPELTFINFNANAPRCLSTATNFGAWRWEITSPGPSSVYGTDTLSTVLSTASGTIPSGGTNRWVVQTTAQPTAGTYIRIIPPAAS